MFINRASFLLALSEVVPIRTPAEFPHGAYTLFWPFCLRFCDGVFSGVTYGIKAGRARLRRVERSEIRGQRSAEDRGQRTEDGGRRANGGGRGFSHRERKKISWRVRWARAARDV